MMQLTTRYSTVFLVVLSATPLLIASENVPWYLRSLVGMEVGPTGAQFGHSDPNDKRYAAKFYGDQIVKASTDANAQYLVIWARDGDYAYYDSQLLPKAPGLGDRDPLREAVDKAAMCKLPLIAYCVVQQGGHYLSEHPEFEMRDAQGNRIGRFCLNSGYLDVLKQLAAEQLAYGIDGFHFDMLDQGFGAPYGCWCDACRQKFEAAYNRPMPKQVSWDEDWDRMLKFRYRTSAEFEQALAGHVRGINPRATVDFNYHGNPPFSWEVGQRPVQHAGNGDFVTGETGVWGFGALTVGLNAEFYRAALPNAPVQVAMQRGVRMYHDQTTRPLADLRWELFTLLSHGAFVTMVDKTAFDGTLDPVAYERIGTAFAEARSKHEHFGQRPLQEVGVWFSSRSRDWIGRETPQEWFRSFLGAHKALVYEHIPWGIVLDENANLDRLNEFRIIVLPNVGILSEHDVTLITKYVDAGGKLIVTGQSGCYDYFGVLRKKTDLESLIGGRFIRKLDTLDNWMRFAEPFGEIRRDWPLLVKGPAAVLQPISAKHFGQLLVPFRTTRQMQGKEGTDWPMSADSSVGPAILLNRFGAGQVLTFTGSPDFSTASEHHLVESRHLLRAAIRLLNPEPRVEISAPLNVEAIVTDDASKRVLRVHLLGYNSPAQTMPATDRPHVLPAMIEEAPLYRTSIRLRDTISTAEAWNASTELDVATNRVNATVNDIHEVIVIHY